MVNGWTHAYRRRDWRGRDLASFMIGEKAGGISNQGAVLPGGFAADIFGRVARFDQTSKLMISVYGSSTPKPWLVARLAPICWMSRASGSVRASRRPVGMLAAI